MDIATILGLILASFAIGYSVFLDLHAIHYFGDVPALLLVFVGTAGCLMIAFPMGEFLGFFGTLRFAFFSHHQHLDELIKTIVSMAEKARKEGVLALQTMAQQIDDPFLRNGIQMCIDGIDPDSVEKLLSTEIENMAERHKIAIEVLNLGTALGPALGLTGTIAHMVHLLSNMSDPSSIGPAMAAAFVCTFYGCIVANVICTPFAAKLKGLNKHEKLVKGIILEGIMSIQAGDNPRMVEGKLHAFVSPKLRKTQFE